MDTPILLGRHLVSDRDIFLLEGHFRLNCG